jgi:two-component system chemotaxis response regulator CheY
MKIMIVDDSRAMRSIVRRSLRKAGFGGHDVVEAQNGAAALEMASQDPPDLILADWNMPEMSGIDLLRALRAAGNQVSFGFITTEGTEAMRKLAADAGARFLLAKPFTPDDMAKHLEGLVK